MSKHTGEWLTEDVGPFFYLPKDIHCDAKDIEDAEKYRDFKTWGDYSEFRDILSKRNPDLTYIEYLMS